MQNLGLTEEDFNRVSDIEQIFQTIENLKDHRFGEIALLTSEQNPNVIIMRKEKFSGDENECCKDILEAKQRLKMEHPSILQMPDFSTKLIQREQDVNEMLVSGYYEYPDWDLEREIEKRQQDKIYFESDILMKLTYEILSAMAYLQSKKIIHGDLRPKYISYNNDVNFPFQLCDRLGDPYPPNKVQINNLKKNNPLYLSPILFKSLSLRKKRIRHNPYKSEVFSLGMIVLEAGVLQSIQNIYDKKEKQINVEEMLNHIENFMNRYGENDLLRESLIWMLDLNGHNRKDPKTIVDMIQNYIKEVNQEQESNQDDQEEYQQSQYEQDEIEVDENMKTQNLQYDNNNSQEYKDKNQFDRIRQERKYQIDDNEYENLNIEDNREEEYEDLNQDEDNLQEITQSNNNQQEEQLDFDQTPLMENYSLRNSQQDQPKINLNLEIRHKKNSDRDKEEEYNIELKDDNKDYYGKLMQKLDEDQQQGNNIQQNQLESKEFYQRDYQNPQYNNYQNDKVDSLRQNLNSEQNVKKHLLSNFDEVNATSQLQTQNSRELSESNLNQEMKQEELEAYYNKKQENQNLSRFNQYQNDQIDYDQRNDIQDNNLHLYQNLNQNQYQDQSYKQQELRQNLNYQQQDHQQDQNNQPLSNQQNQDHHRQIYQQSQNQQPQTQYVQYNQYNKEYEDEGLYKQSDNQKQLNQNYTQENQNKPDPFYVQKKQYTTTTTYQPQTTHIQHNQNYPDISYHQLDQNIPYKDIPYQNNNLSQQNQIQNEHNNIKYIRRSNGQIETLKYQQTPQTSKQGSYILNNKNQYSMNKDLMKFTDNSNNGSQHLKNDFEPQQYVQSQTQPQNKISISQEAPLSMQINQNFEQKNIYKQTNNNSIIDKPNRRTIKARSIYPFNDPRCSTSSQTELRTNNSNSIKREYYVSPTRMREYKQSLSREPNRKSVTDTFDYEVRKEGDRNVRRVYLSRNNESIFKDIADGTYPELNSIYNKPKLEEDWKERYGSNIEIVQQKKNYQVFRLSHSSKQNVDNDQSPKYYQFNQFNKMKFSGWIEYNGTKTPSEITIQKHTQDSFYTEGEDSTGKYTMTAQISSSGRIDIKKQYNGKHLVLMFGRVSKSEDFIREFHGCWEIKNSATGDFEYKLLNQL